VLSWRDQDKDRRNVATAAERLDALLRAQASNAAEILRLRRAGLDRKAAAAGTAHDALFA
jgi:hypothetical protein